MSESDLEVEFKSDNDENENKSLDSSSNLGSLDETENKSVQFSDSDDDDDDIEQQMESSKSSKNSDDNNESSDEDNDDNEYNDNDSDNDEDDDDDGDDFQKFDNETKQKYISIHHPECLTFNHEETETLSRVIRDESGKIVDPYHKTIPILTKYEKTRILGIRTKQLNEGAKPYIDVNSTIIEGYIIAQLELEHKRLPFIIRRPLPNGGSELWKLQDLEIVC